MGDSGVVPSRAPPSLVGSKPRNPPDGATQRRAAAAFGAALLYPRLLLLLLSVVTMMVGGVAGVKQITEHSCYTGLRERPRRRPSPTGRFRPPSPDSCG